MTTVNIIKLQESHTTTREGEKGKEKEPHTTNLQERRRSLTPPGLREDEEESHTNNMKGDEEESHTTSFKEET